MSFQYDQTVLNFDLNFLTQTTNSVVESSDKTEDITITKKKIVATDYIIKKYYETKEAAEELDKTLYTTREDSKKAYIELQKLTEENAQLKNEANRLHTENEELRSKCSHLESVTGATQSHINQLQILVKEKETTIEFIKNENQLHQASLKTCEKKISKLQKKIDNFIRHICLAKDIILGKKKISAPFADILKKYNKKYDSDDNDSLLGEDAASDSEINISRLSSPTISQKSLALHTIDHKGNIERDGKMISIKDDDLDSEFSNEHASADTGRGSSLAFSDAEKCLNSPDYFMDSPMNDDIKENIPRSFAHVATSPIPILCGANLTKNFKPATKDISTSPLMGLNVEEIIFTIEPEDDTRSKDNISKVHTFHSDKEHKSKSFNLPEDDGDRSVELLDDVLTHPVINVQFNDLQTNNTSLLLATDGNSEYEDHNVRMNVNEIQIGKSNSKSNSSYNIEKDKVCFDSNPVHNVQFNALQISNKSLLLATNGTCHYENHDDRTNVNEAQNITSKSETRGSHNILKEKECLESNNSKNLTENVGKDFEIEMILSTMRLSHSIVTPLPSTPSRISPSPSPDKKLNELCRAVPNHCNVGCEEARKARQEIKILQTQYKKLLTHLEKSLLINNQDQIQTNETDSIDDEHDIVSLVSPKQLEYYNLNEYQDRECDKNFIYNTTHEINVTKSVHKELMKSVKKLEFEEPLPMIIQNNFSTDDGRLTLLHGSSENAPKDIENFEEKNGVVNTRNSRLSKPYKFRKLTKLEKFRQKLLPKTKIKRVTNSPLKKHRNKHKQMLSKTSTNNLVSTLNDKNPYETALKVMAEMKSQHKIRELTECSKKSNMARTFKRNNQNKKYIANDNIPILHHVSNSSCEFGEEHNSNASKDQENSVNHKKIRILEDIIISDAHDFNKNDVISHNLIEKRVLTSIQSETELSIHTVASESDVNNKIQLVTPYVEQENIVTLSSELSKSELKANSVNEVVSNNCDLNLNVNKLKPTSSFGTVSNTPKVDFEDEVMTTITKCNESMKSDNTDENTQLKTKFMATRSKSKYMEAISSSLKKNISKFENHNIRPSSISSPDIAKTDTNCSDTNPVSRKRQKRNSVDQPEIACKRVLRSSTLRKSKSEDMYEATESTLDTLYHTERAKNTNTTIAAEHSKSLEPMILTYGDLDLFHDSKAPNNNEMKIKDNSKITTIHPKESILCVMLDKYGKQSLKNQSKKVSDSVITSICKTINKEIAEIVDVFPEDTTSLLKKFVAIIKKWDQKHFLTGLMEYLKDNQRKDELFNKISSPPAPPMTKSEQVLLYVIKELKKTSNDIVESVLCNIEYTLFKINRTPDFNTVETMSHFYAILCRYFKLKSRLRLFMLDAMYCIQFKAVSLIKQCLDVWMHVLPLAHMGIARSPLVTCMVYLLHFYKCEDRFNRVQEIRNILHRKYYYEITEWNEPKILEMFKMAIMNIRAIPAEMKLLRLALIVIAKRNGTKWCQRNIIKNLLLPIIEKEEYSERAKIFCVSMLGPLLKPYPADMKVHCEIVLNLFIDKLKQNPSPQMQEAIFTSLIYMSRHSLNRVLQNLLLYAPKRVSPQFEGIIRDFVRERPLKVWKSILSKIALN